MLEPIHTLDVELVERPGQNLLQLSSSAILQPRIRLAGDLARLEAAGAALRWVRETVPARTPEPMVWFELQDLLLLLDMQTLSAPPRALLASSGLRLLRALGYGLDLEACVTCGRPCASDQAACMDPSRGGLICRACGGAPRVLKAQVRARMMVAMAGHVPDFTPEEAEVVLQVLEQALLAHADVRA